MVTQIKKSITFTVFVLLFVLNVFLQMLLSGEPVDRYFAEVFTNPMGLLNLLSATVLWFISYFFTPLAFYLLGLIIALEFLIIPLLQRFRFITFRSNLFVSVLGAFYIWLLFRIAGVVFG